MNITSFASKSSYCSKGAPSKSKPELCPCVMTDAYGSLRFSAILMVSAILMSLKPFNDHQSHYSGSCILGYNSAPAVAREVSKPSTDSASLVVSSQKNFQFRVRGSLGGGSQVGVFSRFYGLL